MSKGMAGLAVVGCSVLLCSCPVAAYNAGTDLFSMDLEQLLQIEVYSPSRQLTKVAKAPAVITVISAEEIHNRGLKTLKEVLDRVPGFFTMPEQSTYLISNRGFTQNPNGNYLLLLNNHPLNNQRTEGAEELHLFPNLAQVVRIEVIRGPGSTLWGADAAMGIINVITRTAADQTVPTQLDLSVDVETRQHRNIVQAVFGHQFGPATDLTLSLVHTDSAAAWTRYYGMGTSGLELDQQNFVNPYLDINPSYELHSVFNWHQLRLAARLYHFQQFKPFGSFDENPAFPGLSRATEKNSHSRNLMADYTLDFASAGQLDLSLAYDRFNVRSFTNDTEVLPLLSVEDTWTDYDSTAAESIYRIDYQQHKLKIGTQLTARDFRQLRPFYRYQNDVLVQQGVVAHLAGIERAFGAFIEDDYALTPELQLTFGLRYDHNDLRLPGAELYPRFAVVFNPQDQRFGVKYSYNRGFVRPVLERSDGSLSHPVIIRDRFFLGPKVPQTSVSQDLQFSYTDERWLGSLTLYHYRLNDFIARLGYEPGTILNGYLVRYQNQNIGDLTGRGVELEANFQWSPLLKFYGNLALSRASFDDEETLLADGTATFSVIRDMHYADPQRGTTGVPRLLWNFGLDWQWAEHWFVNLHYRGWADNIGKVSTSNQFSRFGPEHFVDLNLIWREVGGSAAELQLYGKNLFGKTLLYPQAPHGGAIAEDYRMLGLQLNYRF